MKRIPLTQGQFALVDDEDFERVNVHKWYAWWNKDTRSFYAVRNCWKNSKKTTIAMHREIMRAEAGSEVDHKNHDTLDNRKAELRLCDVSSNRANTGMRRHNTSGLKGVTWSKKENRWVAQISVDGKTQRLGSFVEPLDAAMAYDHEAIIRFGEFAVTNARLELLH